MTSLDRRASLLGAIDHIVRHGIAGDIVECGVWRGGSMMLAALALMARGDTSRDLWLYDTFEGMSEPGAEDRSTSGESAAAQLARTPRGEGVWCEAGLADVRANLESTGYPRERIHFVEGKVEDTIPATPAGAGRAAPARHRLVRVDAARAAPSLSAAVAPRHPDHRRLRPLAGRAPGGRRVLRRAGRSRSTCTASTTRRGWWSSKTAHEADGGRASPFPAAAADRLAAGLRGGGGAAGAAAAGAAAGGHAHRRRRVRPARLHPGLGRPAGDAGRRRLPRRGDAAGGGGRRRGALAPRPAGVQRPPRALAAGGAARLRRRRLGGRRGGAAARRRGRDRRARLRPRLARHLVPAGDAAAQPLVAGRGRRSTPR